MTRNFGAHVLKEGGGTSQGAASGEDVVEQGEAVTRPDGVPLDLDVVLAVLLAIGSDGAEAGELAAFADQHERET